MSSGLFKNVIYKLFDKLRAIFNKSWWQHPTQHLPPSRKLPKLDETDVQDTAGEAETSS